VTPVILPTPLTQAETEAYLVAQIETLRRIYERQKNALILLLGQSRTAAQAERLTGLLQQVNREIALLNTEVRSWAKEAVKEGYRRGQEAVGGFITREAIAPVVSYGARIHFAAVAVLADQATLDLLTANQTIKRNVQRYIRATQQRLIEDRLITEGIAEKFFIEGARLRDVSSFLEAAFIEQMNGGRFITINGRNYDPGSYASLVARTRTAEAHTAGTINTALEYGLDLLRVSYHAHIDRRGDVCPLYAGKVFSITGSHPVFPRAERLPPYHPNCKHVITVVNEDVLRRRGEYEELVRRAF